MFIRHIQKFQSVYKLLLLLFVSSLFTTHIYSFLLCRHHHCCCFNSWCCRILYVWLDEKEKKEASFCILFLYIFFYVRRKRVLSEKEFSANNKIVWDMSKKKKESSFGMECWKKINKRNCGNFFKIFLPNFSIYFLKFFSSCAVAAVVW